jgi:hypothetical protein
MLPIRLSSKYAGIAVFIGIAVTVFASTVYPRVVEQVGVRPAAPRIAWSEPKVFITLSPGQSVARQLTFLSSEDLTNVQIRIVDGIAPFVSVADPVLPVVSANEATGVSLAFQIPDNADLGLYEGNLHLRQRSATLAHVLKIVVRVSYEEFAGQGTGVSFPVPHGSEVGTTGNLFQVFDPDSPALPATFELRIFVAGVKPDQSPEAILFDVARDRLGDNFIDIARYAGQGIIVEGGHDQRTSLFYV